MVVASQATMPAPIMNRRARYALRAIPCGQGAVDRPYHGPGHDLPEQHRADPDLLDPAPTTEAPDQGEELIEIQ